MAETVGQHSVAAFTSPVNGTTPIDANTVRGNDNTVRSAYVDHDSDPGIHVQSSTLASRPTAGTAGRKWVTVSSGRYQFWYDDGSRWHEVASDAINVDCLADANLAKGDVIKITGFNNGQNLPTVNKVTSSTDVAFGIVENTVTSGNIVQIVNTGLIEDVDTNGYAVGTILYPNSSGGWTTTKPTSGNYQPAGFVLRGNSSNGVLYAEFSAPRIVERSDNTASTIVLRDASGNFAAGTITAGAVTSTGLVTFASLKGTGATTVTNILDEDNMASDSATALATQQSIKAYVDTKVATVDTLAEVLANGNTTGATDIIVTAGQKITTNTIDETTAAAGVTIDSVLLKDDVVNATDIEVDTISANNGTLAVTLASTGVATIAQQPILSSLTASQAVFTDASKGLVSNAITGTGNVVMSASPTLTGTVTAATLNATTLGGTLSTAAQPNVTSLGTLSSLAVTGNLTLGADVVLSRGAADRLDLASGDSLNVVSGTYKIANTDVLSATTLGSGVTASSLTSLGTLSSLTVQSSGSTTAVTVKAPDNVGQVGIWSATSNTQKFAIYLDGGSAFTLRDSVAAANRLSVDSSGNLAVDTNTLYVDAANNRVGIGTASPVYTLDVQGGRALHTDNSDVYAVGVRNRASLAPNGNYWIGATNAVSPDMVFSNNAGTERMRLTDAGNLGLGVTPSAWSGGKAIERGFAGTSDWGFSQASSYRTTNAYFNSGWKYGGTGAACNYAQEAGAHTWSTAASGTAGNAISFTDAMKLDASGNLGVGVTPSHILDVGANNSTPKTIALRYSTLPLYLSSTFDGTDGLNTLSINNNNTSNGSASWASAANSVYSSAAIQVTCNTSGGTVRFLTSAATNTAPTERARITSGGYFKASNDGTYNGATGTYHELRQSANTIDLLASVSNGSYSSAIYLARAVRAANSAYSFLDAESDNGVDREFQLRGDGNGYADGTWNNNGADYAEYFESATGEALTVGATVVLDGNKVREATASDDASAVMGVVRPKAPGKASMVVGNTAWNKWSNKYLTDDFDCYVMEAHEVIEWTDAEGKSHSYESHRIPADVEVPDNATVKTHDENGNPFEHYKLNPAYDPSVEYVPREKRDEWVIVGMVGQVKVLKGQPVNDRWVKMRDVSASVEEWMIR